MTGAKRSHKLMTRGNILLVDDDPGFLTALTKTLVKQGYAVTSAANAADVAEAMRKRKEEFDLVITDLSMPMIDGLAVLAAIKTAFSSVPVIVITAFGDETTQAKAKQQGAFAFVHKPLDHEKFLSLVERVATGETRES
jgi:two-component system, NtrC family, response regulator HydG